MRKISLYLIFSIFYFFNSIASAGSWSSWSIPTSIYKARDGIIVFTSGGGNPENCHSANNNRFYLVTNDNGEGIRSDEFLSMMMTAISSNTEVRFYLDGCYVDSFVTSNSYSKIKNLVQYKQP